MREKTGYKKRRSFALEFIKRLVCSSTFKDLQLQRFAFFYTSSCYLKTSGPFLVKEDRDNEGSLAQEATIGKTRERGYH